MLKFSKEERERERTFSLTVACFSTEWGDKRDMRAVCRARDKFYEAA